MTVRRGADLRAGAQRSRPTPPSGAPPCALARPRLCDLRLSSVTCGRLAAAAQGLPLIRDTEIENLLKDYSLPIFKAAGLGAQNISMRIIRHESFNAFVVDGRNVFINTGTLTQAKTPNEVIGVIAHETGHIAGGHLAQLSSRIARDADQASFCTVLGIGLMVGGAISGGDTAREIGAAGGGLAWAATKWSCARC